MEFNINHMTPVLFGPDTSLQTGARLKALGCTKVLVVYDEGIKKAGIPDKIIASIKEAGIGVAVYEGVKADPPDYTIDEGAEIGRKEQVDGVVAIGGGSSMDTAKAINLMLTNPTPVKQYLGARAMLKPGKPIILIPTTSGTSATVGAHSITKATRSL